MKKLVLALSACLTAAVLATTFAQTSDGIEVAQFDDQGRLIFPSGTDTWVTLGSGLGGDYEAEAFDPANPGTMSHVQIEPTAYRYFMENGSYAEGTMLLLSFYHTLDKPEPQLRGFAQGELAQREIHLIDARQFAEEGRAFFIYSANDPQAAAAIPPGSECVQCHEEHGDFDGTFTQFYPHARTRLATTE